MFFVVVFFFFQAEDGIRDLTVTGVQTCALPISSLLLVRSDGARIRAPLGPGSLSDVRLHHPVRHDGGGRVHGWPGARRLAARPPRRPPRETRGTLWPARNRDRRVPARIPARVCPHPPHPRPHPGGAP